MSIERQFNRHGKPAVANPPEARGVSGQHHRHIIKRGIRHARRFVNGPPGGVRYVAGLFPVELHATKGWRFVPAWS